MYMHVARKSDAKKAQVVYDDKGQSILLCPSGETYELKYDWNREEGDKWLIKSDKTPLRHIYNDYKDFIIDEDMYWRKFNALHVWLVQNYDTPNVDDCERHNLSVEKVKELYDIICKCIDVFPDKSEWITHTEEDFRGQKFEYQEPELTEEQIEKLEALLPTQSGFFFGSCEYDSLYYKKLKYTKEELDKIMPEIESGEVTHLIYQASW